VCLWVLAFVILLTRGKLGATSYYSECVDNLDEKDEERLAPRNLEDDSIGHMEYLKGEESTDF